VTGPWLVTGASGFLGRHLLQAVCTHDPARALVALVRDRTAWERYGWTRPLGGGVTLLTGTVTESGSWARAPALDGLAGVFHLAALVKHRQRDARDVLHTNVEGTLQMVRLAAAHRCRMVFVSTSGTVGCFRRPGPSADETAPHCEAEVAHWPYYRSKVEAEKQARGLAELLGVELVIVRPPVILGPGDHRFRSTAHVRRFLHGRLPFLIRGGIHFVDVRDVAPALIRVMTHPAPKPVYHLCGTICTIEEFFGLVAQVAGRPPPRLVLPYRPAWWVARLSDAAGRRLRGKPFDAIPEPSVIEIAARHWATHSLYAEADLGYRSRPARETLADTVQWLREADR
jgi:nucleoside-diphosphate-sugar epimerase